MPSPVLPEQFSDAIPANNADFCTRFTKWLNVPSLLYQFFNWFLTTTGAISEEAKQEIATYSAPTGTVIYTLTTSVGDGWLYCDGRAVSRTDYAALFTAIGTRYGSGDGSTTFNLPDGRGRSMLGAGTGDGLTSRDISTKYVGEESHTQTVDEMPAHTHDITSYSSGGTSGDGADVLNQPDPGTTRTHETEETGGGAAFNVIHPCLIGYMHVKT